MYIAEVGVMYVNTTDGPATALLGRTYAKILYFLSEDLVPYRIDPYQFTQGGLTDGQMDKNRQTIQLWYSSSAYSLQ